MSDGWLGLSIGASALRAFQQSLNVVQHNISNADTEGYTRQRAELAAIDPSRSLGGFISGGVVVADITQLRDKFVEANIRNEVQTQGKWEAKDKIYQQLELIFNEPSETGLSAEMSDFWNNWQNLANSPDDVTIRTNLRGQAANLTSLFHQINTRLDNLTVTINDDIKIDVNSINSSAKRISEINSQIRSIEAVGTTANELRDERGLLLEKLNKIIGVNSIEHEDGTLDVNIQGHSLVTSTIYSEMETVVRPGDVLGLVDLKWKDSDNSVTVKNGDLKGLFEMRDEVIPSYLSKVDTLASGLIEKVNAVHKTGMGLDGSSKITGANDFTGVLTSDGSFKINGVTINVLTGYNLNSIVDSINDKEADTGVKASMSGNKLVLEPSATNPQSIAVTDDPDSIMFNLGIVNNFFSGTDSGDIALDDNILNDISKIAASDSGAPGDNVIAKAIADLKQALTMENGTVSFDGYYNSTMATLGVDSQEASHILENQNLVMVQLDNLKQSTSGVSIDEELVKMLEYQRAYEASAKFINVVDGLLNTLINGIK